MDTAQKSRMITFDVNFDVDLWAKWAETAGIDGRAINFALFNGEQLFKNDGVQVVNARNYTTFCNAIGGVPDWSKTESLGMILTISKGCFTDPKNVVGHLFTMFIANKLDKLISPEDLLKGDWDTVHARAKQCVYDNGHYRADIASVLATRFLNYSIKYFDTKGSKESVVCERLLKFVDASQDRNNQIFSEDLLFNIAKTLVTKYPGRTNKLMMNSKIRKALM